MPFKSTWSLRIRCNSATQAEQVTQSLLKKIHAEPTTIRSSRFPGTNIPGITTHSFDRPGFEVTFELSHNGLSLENALQEVLRMASAASRHWNLYFRSDGTVEGMAKNIHGMWTPSLTWSLSNEIQKGRSTRHALVAPSLFCGC